MTEGVVHRSRSILGLESTNEPLTQTEYTPIPEILPDNTEHEQKNCTKAAILELPPDGFTRAERKQGWIIIHILLACYCFWFLASICDDYFVPSIQSICSGKFPCTSLYRIQLKCLILYGFNGLMVSYLR